jgi:hypothetical protein
VPTVVKLHERLALPDPETPEGVMVHAVLFDNKLTTPANPFKP